MSAMFHIFNRLAISQAGRRGFEPRLPLHLSNNLADSTSSRFTSFTSKTRVGSTPQLAPPACGRPMPVRVW